MQTGSGCQPASYSVDRAEYAAGVKQPEGESNPSLSSNAEAGKEKSYIPILP
jgi:hypothetical protein